MNRRRTNDLTIRALRGDDTSARSRGARLRMLMRKYETAIACAVPIGSIYPVWRCGTPGDSIRPLARPKLDVPSKQRDRPW